MLGVAVGSGQQHIVVLAGLAAGIGESLSMGAVVYTSTQADRDLWYHSETQERREIEEVPDTERQEVRGHVYAGQGFSGALLDEIVDTVTADKERWLRLMMTEELKLPPEPPKPAMRAALVTLVTGALAALVPLVPFLVLSLRAAMLVCVLASVVALFSLGAYKARLTGRALWKDGLQFVVIGGLAALAAIVAGLLLHINSA